MLNKPLLCCMKQMVTAKNNKRKPVWLEARWKERKQETLTRVKNAVQALLKEGRSVSIRLICDKVREQTGHSLSPTTIKQNSAAYDLYCQHASRKPAIKLKDSALRQLLGNCSKSARPSLQAKVTRLKQVTKEDLIVRLIRLEREVKESKTVENKLRERLIELEIFAHKNKKD
jgi:hypothetical protein